jgi:hypothetical protein
MKSSFARAFAVFCILLGVTFGGEKFFLWWPPKLMLLSPVVALIYLGCDILMSSRPIRRKS